MKLFQSRELFSKKKKKFIIDVTQGLKYATTN